MSLNACLRSLAVLGGLASGCSGRPSVLIHVRQTAATPALIRYRDGSNEWKSPVANDAARTYDSRATDDFEVVNVVALADGSFVADRLLATVDDGTCWFYGSPFALDPTACSVPAAPPATVMVNGQVAQTGEVWIGGASARGYGQWNYSIVTTAGVHDIIALTTSGPDTYATIRRDRDFEADASEPIIDGVVDGQALEPVPVVVGGIESDAVVMAKVTVTTAHDSAVVSSSLQGQAAFAVPVVPQLVLSDADTQTLELAAASSVATRGASTRISGMPISLELVPLPSVSYQLGPNPSATWSDIVTGEQGGVFVLFASDSTQQVAATERWLQGNAHRLAFEAGPPDYEPAWRIDTAAPFTRSFQVWSDSGPVRYWVNETRSGP
jgi:hypothetical protein